ncbi:MAG: aconitase X swivel domain-containing protein [Candidatus Limnocylindria bacterium]
MTIRGRLIAPGAADGSALVLAEPLSLWGGIDPATGRIIDVHHPQRGASVAGRVLVMPSARGSSSSASVLAEAVRAGAAPVAIVLGEPDLILAIGAAVAEELYGVRMPIAVAADANTLIRDGSTVGIDDDGRIGLLPAAG